MRTLTLHRGFGELDAFDRVVRRAFAPAVFGEPSTATTAFTPAAEVVRDGDDALVRLELPGIDVSKDVTVEVKGNRLIVFGERRDERSSEQGGRSLREVRYGSFQRSFGLPATVTADAVSARYDAGVLSVRVAGAYADTSARTIEISTATPVAVQPTEAPRTTDATDTPTEASA